MGVVYLGRHPQLGFEVAIKVLLADPGARPGQLERFRRELDALAQLQHPGLVDVLEAGERDGRPWFAMRRVAGENLEARLQTRGRLSPSEVIELGLQLCRALGHAHERGLIHRDLKPAFFAMLCRAELADLSNARRVLRARLKELEKEGKLSPWHEELGMFLLGETNEARLLSAAKGGETPEDVRARLCEGYFYVGAIKALEGDLQGARARLRSCLDHQVAGYKEVSAAQALLRRVLIRSRR